MAGNKDILRELEAINSPLAGVSRDMPFDVPQGYFDNLPVQVWHQANEEVLLPGTTMPHIVHPEYFDTLPEQLLESIKKQEQKQPATRTNSISLWKNIRWAAAAMLILAIGFGTYRVFNPQPVSVEQQLQAISDEAIMSYVEDNIYAFETETIVNYMNTADINSAS
ncbi:MAG TPA: hypothetical protein VIN07_00900, partial [Flavipsychrobacter sp.]